MRSAAIRAGWSKTRVPISPDMLVVDIGSGAFPHPRADVLCDRELTDDTHRAGAKVVLDGRPLVCADVTALPFRVGSVDFVIVSHLAEHVEDPDAMCRELVRVAAAGYLETPSPGADYVLDEAYHLWRVGRRDGVLEFRSKPPKPARLQRALDRVYAVFYAAQPTCAKPTYELPGGPVGKVCRVALRGVGGVLNRSGLMHTRVVFTPVRPLRWRVDSGR